jgi:hypothetical protein
MNYDLVINNAFQALLKLSVDLALELNISPINTYDIWLMLIFVRI